MIGQSNLHQQPLSPFDSFQFGFFWCMWLCWRNSGSIAHMREKSSSLVPSFTTMHSWPSASLPQTCQVTVLDSPCSGKNLLLSNWASLQFGHWLNQQSSVAAADQFIWKGMLVLWKPRNCLVQSMDNRNKVFMVLAWAHIAWQLAAEENMFWSQFCKFTFPKLHIWMCFTEKSIYFVHNRDSELYFFYHFLPE